MKKLALLCFSLIVFTISCKTYSSKSTFQNDEHRFVKKMPLQCSKSNIRGYKVFLIPANPTKGYEPKPYCTYEFGNLIKGYSHEQKIRAIEELLSFELDTSQCAMQVCKYGYSNSPFPQTRYYTTQIDALYLLTLIAASSYSIYYCPYPVLIDTQTGKEINGDFSKVREVYALYKKWFEQSKAINFKNYALPLVNKRYEWYGGEKERDYIFSDTFKMAILDAPAIVTGNCKD